MSEPTLYTLDELVRAANVKHVPTSLKLLLKEAVPVVRCVHGNIFRHIVNPRAITLDMTFEWCPGAEIGDTE